MPTVQRSTGHCPLTNGYRDADASPDDTSYDHPMYQPASRLARTPAEQADQDLSWQRCDERFFAAGACHILAWTFLRTHPNAGFRAVGLRLAGEQYAWHVYVTDDVWAFDYYGWTPEQELLEVTQAEKAGTGDKRPLQRVELPSDLTVFCREHFHYEPHEFAELPWARAQAYLARFAAEPPSH